MLDGSTRLTHQWKEILGGAESPTRSGNILHSYLLLWLLPWRIRKLANQEVLLLTSETENPLIKGTESFKSAWITKAKAIGTLAKGRWVRIGFRIIFYRVVKPIWWARKPSNRPNTAQEVHIPHASNKVTQLPEPVARTLSDLCRYGPTSPGLPIGYLSEDCKYRTLTIYDGKEESGLWLLIWMSDMWSGYI